MNPQKYTIQQFGAMIKEKYPQYAKYDDAKIGQETLTTHPEYKNRIVEDKPVENVSMTPAPIQKAAEFIGGNIKDAATGLMTQFGGSDQGIASKLKQNVEAGAEDMQKGIDTGNPNMVIKGGVKSGLRTAGDVNNAIFAVPGAAVAATGFNKVADWVGEQFNPLLKKVFGSGLDDIPEIQEFAMKHPNLGEDFGRALGLVMAGSDATKIDPKTIVERTKAKMMDMVPPKDPTDPNAPIVEKAPASSVTRNIMEDITPTADRLVNYSTTKAFNLTPGDVKNISFSTGNEPGKFMADHNLIGNNAKDTVKNINDFYKTNYDAVRKEINDVKETFKINDVPRYKEALNEIKTQVKDVPGMQSVNSEVDSLLRKPTLTLGDVQRVKELMDEHFNLYKVTGDVKDSVAKAGLANIRSDLRTFIENRVMDATGADIKALNNNVSTAKSLANAIEERTTSGLAKSHLKIGDLGVFGVGTGVGGPLVGAALLLGKKIIESPTFRLRFAKWLDGMSDSQKSKVKSDIEKGIVPDEFKKEIVPNVEKDTFPADETSGPMEMGTYKLGKNETTGLVEPTGEYRKPGVNFYSKEKTSIPKDEGVIPQTISKELKPLVNEAKKYKSVEEFVNSFKHYAVRDMKNPGIDLIPIGKVKQSGYQKTSVFLGDKEMAKFYDEGGTLPPIIVDKNFNLIDGRHRLSLYTERGVTQIPVIRDGGKSQLTDIWNKANNK